jgi:L-tryptophan--pyruvate aminotransferase
MKELDLMFGNPEFMWKHSTLTQIDSYNCAMYKDAESSEALIDAIKRLHIKYNNTDNHDGYILITNGASQAISAAGYAFNKGKAEMHGCIDAKPLRLEAPYWGRIPTLLKAGFKFGDDWCTARLTNKNWSYETDAEFLTSPSNPSCKKLTLNPKSKFTILDSCYNWPQYATVHKQRADIEIYSMSKLSGFAGLRIGWALIKDKEVYEAMKQYVYLSTIGVSAAAQAVAVSVINELSTNEYWLRNSMNELDGRWSKITSVLNGKKSVKMAGDSSGMFLYLQVPEMSSFLTQINTKGSNGLLFGDTDDKVRFNIGCNYDDFEEFIKRLEGIE